MQALTRNPLADPGLLGVNAGAAVAVVIGIGTFGIGSALGYLPFAFAGAAIASVVVYLLGSAGRSGATPVRLALAGVAVTAALTAVIDGMTLLDPATFDKYRFWAVGSLNGRGLDVFWPVLPFIVVGAGDRAGHRPFAERAGHGRRRRAGRWAPASTGPGCCPAW